MAGDLSVDQVARTFREWTAPDGTRYRLVLEAPARHRVRARDRRFTLTFVNNTELQAKQISRMVTEDFALADATADQLTALLMPAS